MTLTPETVDLASYYDVEDTEEFKSANNNGFPPHPSGGRRSLKYEVVCKDLNYYNYVFADGPVRAERIARDLYDIPLQYGVKVTRVPDVVYLALRLN